MSLERAVQVLRDSSYSGQFLKTGARATGFVVVFRCNNAREGGTSFVRLVNHRRSASARKGTRSKARRRTVMRRDVRACQELRRYGARL